MYRPRFEPDTSRMQTQTRYGRSELAHSVWSLGAAAHRQRRDRLSIVWHSERRRLLGNCICFHPQVKVWGGATTELGPLNVADLNH
jgi:hypothetical protein